MPKSRKVKKNKTQKKEKPPMGSRMTAISDMENGMRIMNWLEENYKVQSTDLTEEEISEETEEQEEESEEEEVESTPHS